MPSTGQIADLSLQVRIYFWVTISYTCTARRLGAMNAVLQVFTQKCRKTGVYDLEYFLPHTKDLILRKDLKLIKIYIFRYMYMYTKNKEQLITWNFLLQNKDPLKQKDGKLYNI